MRDTTKAPVEFTALARDTVRQFLQANEDTNFAVRIQSREPKPARSALRDHDDRAR